MRINPSAKSLLLLAMLIAIAACCVLNFLLSDRVVFTRRERRFRGAERSSEAEQV